MLHDHLQSGRHDEEPGDTLFEGVQHAIGGEFLLHDCADACAHRHDAESRAPDMRAGHANEDRFAFVEMRPRLPFLLARHTEREQVPIGQHRAFRIAGRARGIELEDRVVGSGGRKIVCRRRVDLRHRGLRRDHFGRTVHLAASLGGHVLEARAQKQHLRRGISQYVSNLRGGEAPADRDHHCADTGRRIEHFEIVTRVLAQPGDAVAFAHAMRGQHGDDLAAALLEFGEAYRLVALLQHGVVGALGRPVADEGVERQLRLIGHAVLSPLRASCHARERSQAHYCQRPPSRARFSRTANQRNRPSGPARKVASRMGACTMREKPFASASRAIQMPTKRSKAR